MSCYISLSIAKIQEIYFYVQVMKLSRTSWESMVIEDLNTVKKEGQRKKNKVKTIETKERRRGYEENKNTAKKGKRLKIRAIYNLAKLKEPFVIIIETFYDK